MMIELHILQLTDVIQHYIAYDLFLGFTSFPLLVTNRLEQE